MPKINVYLPDDLAESVREAGIPVSAVCQRALELAVRRITTIREAVRGTPEHLATAPGTLVFTARCASLLTSAEQLAAGQGAAAIGTGHILTALLDEGGNLALSVLSVLDLGPGQVRAELASQPTAAAPGAGTPAAGGTAPGQPGTLRFDEHAAAALELSVAESAALGTNYIGSEHLLLGMIAEPDGAAGRTLRTLGADLRLARKTVAAALAGYTHLQARSAGSGSGTADSGTGGSGTGGSGTGGAAEAVAAIVAEQLKPLVARLDELDRKVSAAQRP
jgi:ATP-dependent Clp protease ATP-binding subunit ClpC